MHITAFKATDGESAAWSHRTQGPSGLRFQGSRVQGSRVPGFRVTGFEVLGFQGSRFRVPSWD